MSENTTVSLRVDSAAKDQAGEILSSLGLTLSDAFNLLLHQVNMVRGLPFEVKQHLPVELNDGYGSYICKFGHVHDYSKFDFDATETELMSPAAEVYDTTDEMWVGLGLGNNNGKI